MIICQLDICVKGKDVKKSDGFLHWRARAGPCLTKRIPLPSGIFVLRYASMALPDSHADSMSAVIMGSELTVVFLCRSANEC